jgi:hypothetical protein
MTRGMRSPSRRAMAAMSLALLVTGCGSTVAGVSGASNGGGLGGPGGTGGTGAVAGNNGAVGSAPGALPGQTVGGPLAGAPGASGQIATAGSGGAVGTTASGSTAAATSGPIKLGFVITNTGNASSVGINPGTSYSNQQMYDALVAAMNKAGGINGRKIEPVYAVTDTASSDWSSDFQAACSKFTQDNHVAAVLGYVFVWLDAFETCLAHAGVPHLNAGYQPGDEAAQRQYPTMFSTSNPTDEGHYLTMLSGAVATGVLTPSTKLGIILDSCGHDDRAWPRSGAPYLAAHHISYESADISCSAGAADNGRVASALQNAELRFRTNGDTVILIEGVPAVIFMNEAESQHWNPTYLMAIQGGGLQGNAPDDQLAHVHGFGWLPEIDVDLMHQPYPATAAQKRCVGMLESEGLKPAQYNDFFSAYVTCDALFLYVDALRLTAGDTSAAKVIGGLESAAPHFDGAATYGWRLTVSNVARGGPGLWRAWAWSNGCSCFAYTGQPHAMPAA